MSGFPIHPAPTFAHSDLRVRVPRLIRHVSKEMAGVFYDGNRTEVFRRNFPHQMDYVNACWPEFVKQARDILIDMLGKKENSEHIKKEIYAAITDDFEERTKDNFTRIMSS